jgi:hypothetical protein
VTGALDLEPRTKRRGPPLSDSRLEDHPLLGMQTTLAIDDLPGVTVSAEKRAPLTPR